MDDFDGQCCRTYPFNHSRIQRWQREKRKRTTGEEEKGSAEGKGASETATATAPSGSSAEAAKGVKSGRQADATGEAYLFTMCCEHNLYYGCESCYYTSVAIKHLTDVSSYCLLREVMAQFLLHESLDSSVILITTRATNC